MEIGKQGKEKPPRRHGWRLNGADPDHHAVYAPLRDPTEIAKERGLRR